MAGESILLIWFLAAFAFALGWAVRHWLHRAGRREEASEPERREEASEPERREELDPHRLEVVLHQAEIDLREEREESRENDR